MRVLIVVALLLLILEALLAFACFAGWYWLGGGLRGTALVVVVILLIVAPWIGELRAEFDSEIGAGSARLAWWGVVRFTQNPPEVRGRWLCIPFRFRARPGKHLPEGPHARTTRAASRRKPSARRRGWALAQALPAALQMLLDLMRDAREVSVQVRAPSQNPYADAAIAGVIGRQHWGPFHLQTAATGDRRLAVRYRIGLLRGFLTVLYAVVQGKAGRVMRG
jgi:hypothetical protein